MFGTKLLSVDQLEEIDRNARAYWFEIGRGHEITEKIEEASSDNPFIDKNWRDLIKGENNARVF